MKLVIRFHAYIINGEKGSGEKSCWLLLLPRCCSVKRKEKDSCGECRSCRQAEVGITLILYDWIMHEKPNSISVDEIREQLVNDVQIKPYSSKYKIYIVPRRKSLLCRHRMLC